MAAQAADYYQVLGVPRDADAKTIKNAFRRLACRYPDTSAEPEAEQRFKEIAEAYGVLSDPARRARYDTSGVAGLAGATPEDLWSGIDFARPGTIPRTCPDCAGTGQRTMQSQRGTVLVHQVTACQACQGRRSIIDQPCPDCHGTGRAVEHDKVTVRIPPASPKVRRCGWLGAECQAPPAESPAMPMWSSAPRPTPASPGRAPISGMTCTSRYPTPCSAPPQLFPHSTGSPGSRSRPEPSPARSRGLAARVCPVTAATAGET